jgi:serine protease Do
MKRLIATLIILALMAVPTMAQERADTLGVYGTLVNNNPLGGTFESGIDMHLFEFDGAASDLVTIQMIALSNDLDPALVLLGIDGSIVGWNDDSNNQLNATISAELPYSGTYFVLATTFRSLYEQGEFQGDYQIVLNGVSPIDPQNSTTDDDLLPLEPDNVYEAITLDASTPVFLATLTVQDTLAVNLYAESDTLDTVLYVFNTKGERIALDDDSSGYNYSAELKGVPLDEPGQYMIMVVTRGYEREEERDNINGFMNLWVDRS